MLGAACRPLRGAAGRNERDFRLSRRFIRTGIRAPKRKNQSLQLTGGPVDSLARIYFLNFNETPYPPADRLDGEVAKPAVTNK